MTMKDVNAIATAMEAAACGADAKQIVAACAALSLKYQVAAGLMPQGQIIPFERPLHRHPRNLGRMSPLDCA